MESDVDSTQLEAAFQQLYERFKTATPQQKNNFSSEITSLASKLCGPADIQSTESVLDQHLRLPKIEITQDSLEVEPSEPLTDISGSNQETQIAYLDPSSLISPKDIPSSPGHSTSGFDSDYESAGSPTSSDNGADTLNTFENELESEASEGLEMDWSLTLSSLFPPPAVEV